MSTSSDGNAADRSFSAGDIVRDRDDDDPDDAVVVNTPPVPASEWEVRPLDTTLAADNPNYPTDSPTVVVVYRTRLDEYAREADPDGDVVGSGIDLGRLVNEGIPFYAFPAPRLAHVDEQYEPPDSEDVATEPEANGTVTDRPDAGDPSPAKSADLDPLAEHLSSSGMRVIDRDEQAGTLTVKKLRDTYVVEPGHVLEGDGQFRQRLDRLVEEF